MSNDSLIGEKAILSRNEAAECLGVCLNTLAALEIPCVKLGRRVVYLRATLMDWLAKREA